MNRRTKSLDDFLTDVVKSLPVVGNYIYANEDARGGEQHWYEHQEEQEQANDRPYFSKGQKRIVTGVLTAIVAASLAFNAHLASYSIASRINLDKVITISPEQNRMHFWFSEDEKNMNNYYCVEIDIGEKEPRLVRITQSSSEDLRRIGDIFYWSQKEITRTTRKQIKEDDVKYNWIIGRIKKHVENNPKLKVYAPPWILEKRD